MLLQANVFYKERLANSRDGKLQLIKTLEKIHFGKINTAFLLEGSQSADHLPPTIIRLPYCGLLLD